MDRIEGMKDELSRLLKERPALEAEKRQVFAIIDHAPHMTSAMREEIHALYNHRLANVQEDITGIMNQIVKMGGDVHG